MSGLNVLFCLEGVASSLPVLLCLDNDTSDLEELLLDGDVLGLAEFLCLKGDILHLAGLLRLARLLRLEGDNGCLEELACPSCNMSDLEEVSCIRVSFLSCGNSLL